MYTSFGRNEARIISRSIAIIAAEHELILHKYWVYDYPVALVDYVGNVSREIKILHRLCATLKSTENQNITYDVECIENLCDFI